jgi:hypothetical protein
MTSTTVKSIILVSAMAPIIFKRSENLSRAVKIIFMGIPDSFFGLMLI